jgi:hypothetical protein
VYEAFLFLDGVSGEWWWWCPTLWLEVTVSVCCGSMGMRQGVAERCGDAPILCCDATPTSAPRYIEFEQLLLQR